MSIGYAPQAVLDSLRDRAERVEALLAINARAGKPNERGFLTFGLEAAERLTHSQGGFLHFINDDQETLELVTWTAGALATCAASYDRHYPLSSAGIWASCFHTREPVVINDYTTAEGRHGLPAGHVAMTRLISVPVVDGDRVRMILGVGNKASDYIDYDVETLQLVGNDLWRIAHAARVERELAASRNRFESIFNAIGEGLFLHDAATGAVVDVNDATTQMFGYSRAELLNLTVGHISEGRTPYTQAGALERLRAAREGQPQRFEWRGRRKNGSLFWIEVSLRCMDIGGQGYLIAAVADIDERKQAQQAYEATMKDLVTLNVKLEEASLQLLQSEKMASIGQLAAGVAHEINNPVGFVVSNIGSLEKYLTNFFAMFDAYENAEPMLAAAARETVQRLRAELDIDYLRQDVAALLAETREGVNRVRKIVQDLKDFSRVGAEDAWQWADLHAGLDSTLNIVWNELKYKTTVEKEYGELPQVWCLASQLNQVFMNLLVNAAHAIEKQGVVTIRTGRRDDEVWIEVNDTGCGISPENLPRIFDPFFTTKPVGKGTGLGLAVSYGIVQKHRGRIEVRSEVGKGTAFRVWLPIAPPPEDEAARPATADG